MNDVIISGAGPVGLFLACELALAKCSVLILEKSDGPGSPLKELPFGIRGLSAPTIEALYRRDLLAELEIHKRLKNPHTAVAQGARKQIGHFAGIPFYEDNVDTTQWAYRLKTATATNLISGIHEIETILTRRANALGVQIMYGSPIIGFHQTDDDVIVQADHRSFEARWLVGCDGARSVVRKSGGFEFAGTDPEFTGYNAQVDIVDPEKLGAGRITTPRGMYLQSQPGYLIMQDFDGGAFHNSDRPLTLEHLQQVLRRISGTDVTLSAMHIATTWTDRSRQATSYRNGRVLLAGDAAHIHSPLGGQGLNLGLGDAMNLGWKLAATIGGTAPKDLLDTYHSERHPVGATVLDWSRAQVAIMRPDAHSRALNSIMRDLINTRDGATYIAGRVWGVFNKYDLDGSHPLIGCSVPDFQFHDGATIGDLMHDGQGILVDFDNNGSLATMVSKYDDRIKYVSCNAKDQFGLRALLVRPDGIVAWVDADSYPNDVEVETVIRKWFGE
jgi:2-polyprenyl-6-methoxyphenol hydroxylase-like FAD-dependent oxidoreductase